MKPIYRQNILFVIFVFFLFSCSDSGVDSNNNSSTGIKIDKQWSFTAVQMRDISRTLQIPDSFSLSYSVDGLSIAYRTSDFSGHEIEVSGALFIPQNVNNVPLLSIQHGTETKRDLVASVHPINSVEGITGLLTASQGYVVCVPDYPGFGVSTSDHPYLHASSLAKSVIDFLLTAKIYLAEQNILINDQLFLAGYSEGGFVTLAVQKEIEEKYADALNITAVAPMAGPYNLSGLTEYLLQQESYPWPAYIAYFLNAYNNIYHWDKLDEIFNEPFNTTIPTLFDGTKTFFEINDQLPEKPSELFRQQFIENYLAGNEIEVKSAIAENTLLNWTPQAPVHFFHGGADQVSPYQIAIVAYQSLIENGAADIMLTTIPGGTHSTASLPSILGALKWFDNYRENNVLATKF